MTTAMFTEHADLIPDPRNRVDAERADAMEAVKLRLLWAIAAGGDEGICASCAVAVIKFAEGDGKHWTDRNLRGLHRRLCAASGLTARRYAVALERVGASLFLPL